MKKERNGEYIFSASDLVHYLACHHLTFLDLKSISEKINKESESSVNKLLQEKGFQHEFNYLQTLRTQGKTIVEIPRNKTFQERVKLTEEASRKGPDVIYQGVLYNHPLRGDVDFLMKINMPSDLGDYSYEVLDTKLAVNPESKHIIQLSFYSDLLENIQGVKPNEMYLVLGDGSKLSFKVDDFLYYYMKAKQRFEAFVMDPPVTSYPEPCQYCKMCDWLNRCSKQWQEDSHLSLVANIQRTQIDKLRKADINTVEELALTPLNTKVPELNQTVFQRLRSQAALQTNKTKTGENKYEILSMSQGQGFNRMPIPDSGDLFFDMEGDPLYSNGLEYLFGIYYVKNDKPIFLPFWAHDHDQERETFKEFMKFLGEHMIAYPNAHIYHYNHYETTALKRLACRYAIAEEQLDNLLRKKKFIDLYKVVRESIRTSEPGCSIKNLETFYMEKREGSVATAVDSIVFYNEWRKTQEEQILKEIAKYNEIDCISTLKLRDWLLTLRPSNCEWFKGSQVNNESNLQERKDWEIEYEQYQKLLLDNTNDDNYQLKQRIADLLEFHNREAKPQWWAMFERQDKFEEELIEDAECLAGLTLLGSPFQEKKSLIYTFQFPPQEYKLRQGSTVLDVYTMEGAGTIVEIDEANCLVKLKKGIKTSLPQSLSIGPPKPISSETMRTAIYKVANSIINNKNTYQALLDILNNTIPRIKGKVKGESIITSDDLPSDAIKAVLNLDESYLFIQGPPGSGKTFTSAQIIIELMLQHKKVGIAANSHKAIHNLLDKIEEMALQQNFQFTGIKKSSAQDNDTIYQGRNIQSENTTDKIPLNISLLAGTAWLFSHERFDKQLDYLFIEEAGQVSVANVVAMGTSAKNIILVGDQMQLGQPIQGTHPGDAGKSILEFLLGDHATIPPDRGIFLNNTRRLHPKICKFISEAIYDGRLNSHASTLGRSLIFVNPMEGISNEGIYVIPAQHTNCSQKSEEEGEIIKKYYHELLCQKFKDKNGSERDLTLEDILVVTPYNVQVNHLSSILPSGARVGTVDKFQGQEAPVVLISMVTSSVEDLPRNIEFLYSKNRLNVALSRAQCLALVVVNPKLFEIPCKTINQMMLVNTFCWMDKAAMTVPN